MIENISPEIRKGAYIKTLAALLFVRRNAQYSETNVVKKLHKLCRYIKMTNVSMNLTNIAINKGVWR